MIKYRPNLDSLLWSRKCQEYYETIDDLKAAIADHHTKFCRFIGKDRSFRPEDVLLHSSRDHLFGWENYHVIELDGITIGFCGE
jgi:hypothetical protein